MQYNTIQFNAMHLSPTRTVPHRLETVGDRREARQDAEGEAEQAAEQLAGGAEAVGGAKEVGGGGGG